MMKFPFVIVYICNANCRQLDESVVDCTNFNSLQLIVAMDVIENASVNSDDGKDDAEQRNCCKFVDKLHTDIDDSAWVRGIIY